MLFGPSIATDLDGVLADVERSTQMKVFEQYGIFPKPGREDKFYMHERYESREVAAYAKTLFNSPTFLESLPGFKYNISEIKRWYDACTIDQVYIITGRSSDVRMATLKWLYNHSVPFTALVTDSKNRKHYFTKALGCDFLVEDRLDEAERVAKNGVKVYLIERPYNIMGKETSEYADRITWVENFRDIGKLEKYV